MDWAADCGILPEVKQEYKSQVLQTFQSTGDSYHPSDPKESPTPLQSFNEKSARASSQKALGTGLKPLKRNRFGDSQSREDKDGHDEKKRCTPQLLSKGSSGSDCILFACPFVKRYPGRYQECYSHVLKDSSRVKQHLRVSKSHQLPIYCPRCSETFESDSLRDAHLRGTCVSHPEKMWEGITTEQRQQLNKRSQSSDTEEERWFKVWDILFRGVPRPSTPYIDASLAEELQVFREHLLSEGPAIWNQIVQTRLPETLREHSEDLALLHESTFPELVAELCARWNANRNPAEQAPVEIEVTPIADLGRTGSETPFPVAGSDSALGNSIPSDGNSDCRLLNVNSDFSCPVSSSTPPWVSGNSIIEPSLLQETPVSVPLHQEHQLEISSPDERPDHCGNQLLHPDLFEDLDYSSFQDPGHQSFQPNETIDYSWLVN